MNDDWGYPVAEGSPLGGVGTSRRKDGRVTEESGMLGVRGDLFKKSHCHMSVLRLSSARRIV